MIPKKSLDSVLDKSIILTITAPNDNAKSISVKKNKFSKKTPTVLGRQAIRADARLV